jgi:hypothetical protein
MAPESNNVMNRVICCTETTKKTKKKNEGTTRYSITGTVIIGNMGVRTCTI